MNRSATYIATLEVFDSDADADRPQLGVKRLSSKSESSGGTVIFFEYSSLRCGMQRSPLTSVRVCRTRHE